MNCGNCGHEVPEDFGIGSKDSHFRHCAWWITLDLREQERHAPRAVAGDAELIHTSPIRSRRSAQRAASRQAA